MSFDFKKKYILENEAVLLRPLELSDKKFLIDFAIYEPEIWKFNVNCGNGKENFEKYFASAIQQFDNEKEYPFIVFDKKENKYVGSTRIYDVSNEFNRLDIGYTWYGKEFQGTGINKNCKYLLLELVFDKLEMKRVGFGANSKNERSINAMKSIGCTVEGILREYSKDAEGNIIDAIKLSILKSEWDNTLKLNLKKRIEEPFVSQ
jgi:RimJ/RimL family protein N-acetyltransferase